MEIVGERRRKSFRRMMDRGLEEVIVLKRVGGLFVVKAPVLPNLYFVLAFCAQQRNGELYAFSIAAYRVFDDYQEAVDVAIQTSISGELATANGELFVFGKHSQVDASLN